MERHKCKLCTRIFSNGRALGGHLKSHFATLPLPNNKTPQLVNNTTSTTMESASSASLEQQEEEEKKKNRGGGKEKGFVYGLRENPKKSFRVADPEFSFLVADGGSCVVAVQEEEEEDGESENESRNPTRRRSKRRNRKGKQSSKQSRIDNNNNNNNNEYSSSADQEPASSAVSDTSPEEDDVALCLMMLSTDCCWTKKTDQRSVGEKSEEAKWRRCERCKKGFRSLKALGEDQRRICEGKIGVDEKIFDCPFCSKIFGSGQAIAGHKRSHILASSTTTTTTTTPTKLDAVSIDLNLPARAEEDEYSVVSDA